MEHDANFRSFKEPFRFQRSQQQRLYVNLRLLGPGPATFYREACSLMMPPQQFESTTHLVAHLLREIESAVRRVLLPDNYIPPVASATCDNRPEAHAKQIEEIAQSLGLDKRLQEKWKEIATRNKAFNGLAAMAHREDLSLPREVDSEFEALVSEFESVLDTVLTSFENQSIRVFALLDSLLLKERPSKRKNDLSTLKNKVPHNDATHHYFFERLQHPGWLEQLYQEGFFTPLPPRDWDENFSRPIFSSWPPSPYLLRMAAVESVQQTVLTIMHEVADTENPYVQHNILQIAQVLPAPLAATLVPAIQTWVQGPELRTVELTQVSNLIVHLAQGGERESSIALLETCLTILARKESLSERWQYEQILTSNIPPLVKHADVEALSMLCRLLEAEVYSNHVRHRDVQEDQAERLRQEAQEASTWSWQRTIEAATHGMPAGMRETLNLLVATIRQTAEQAVQEHLIPLDDIVSLFEEHPGRIFRRLALYLLSRFPQDRPDVVKRYLMNRSLFDDGDVHHEYGLLAQVGFPALADTEQERLLQWIDAGPDLQRYRDQYSQIYHVMPSDELAQQYANVWRRDWFGRIGDGLLGTWKARYDALVAECGPIEPEGTTLPLVTWVGPTSALSLEELRSMTTDQMLSYLKTWQPSEGFTSPSREGLGRMLTAIVSEDPGRFAEHADQLQGYDPIYVSAVVEGFTQATRFHRLFDWESVLDLCQWVINQRYSLSEDNVATTFDPEWAWASQMVVYLLLSALEAQPSVLPVVLRSRIWDILKPLTDDPDLALKDETNKEDPINEYATRAINSIRGIALHAVVQYAWWLQQAEQGESRDGAQSFSTMPEVQAVLERHLDPTVDASLPVRSVYGQHLSVLVTLDARWTAEHLVHLFPREADQQALRIVTWNTYIVFCEPYNKVFALLGEEYADAIGRLDTTGQRRSIADDPDYQLGEHLIRFYWSGLLSLASSESLLTRFFTKATDALRGQVLAFIGRVFYHTGEETPSEIIERSQRLWEWRLSEAQRATSIAAYAHELAAFGWWFRTDICPAQWGMQQLEHVLTLVGRIDMSYAVVERLVRLIERDSALVVRCLELLIKGDTMMWTTSTWEKAVQPILSYALQQGEKETQRRARAIISSLALHGSTNYLDLLPKE